MEKFLSALGGIFLICLFGFPQVMEIFFIFVAFVIVANCIIEKIDDIKHSKSKG